MKTQILKTPQKKTFKPFTVQFEIETIEEARLLFHICNHANIGPLIMNSNYGGDSNYDDEMATSFGNYQDILDEILSQGFKI